MTATTVLTMTPNATQQSQQAQQDSSTSSFPKPLEIVCTPDMATSARRPDTASTAASTPNTAGTPSANGGAPAVRVNCMPPSGPAGVVTFSKRVRVKKVRSYRNYTQEELDSTWHSPEDYQHIKTMCIRTLKLMHAAGNANFQDSEEWSSRGLEVRAKKAAQIRKENRAFATNAVLDEQDHQEAISGTTGAKDVDRIRAVYREISGPSQIAAEQMGRRDYDEIIAFMKAIESIDWDSYVHDYQKTADKRRLQQQRNQPPSQSQRSRSKKSSSR